MTVSIGLTGGIASGKSTVSKMLVELGADYIDADLVGHQIYQPGKEAWQEIIDTWGEDLLLPDQTINRQKLGAIVFSAPEALARLNQITHPRIKAELKKEIDLRKKSESDVKALVIEAAILIEANWHPLFDKIWVVITDEKTAIDRLAKSKGMTPEQARARIDAQLSNEERKKYADVVIENNGSLEEVLKQVEKAWAEI
jgi:dephospho-CoA kinase